VPKPLTPLQKEPSMSVTYMTLRVAQKVASGTVLFRYILKLAPTDVAVNVQKQVTTVLDELPRGSNQGTISAEKRVNSMLMCTLI
jgi:hypothetical protein